MKFCNKILKVKMPDSEAGPWACTTLSNYITVQSHQVLKISCQTSNRFDSNLVRRNIVLDLGLKCCKGHQQTTLVGKEFSVNDVDGDHQINIV